MLEVANLSKRLGLREVVSNVSLHVLRGEAVGLLGPNGAGKTTVFQMIAGLIAPDSGSITLDDEDITGQPIFERARRGLSYLPQMPSTFLGLTVEQNIMLMLEVSEPDPAQRQWFVELLLERFALGHARHLPAARISGGERRRCEIARTLAARPSFVLFDEPFVGIDPIAISEIRQIVRTLTGAGIGILITDHNVRETLGSIDRAYLIENGYVVIDGTAKQVAEDLYARDTYFGTGSTR